MQELPYAQHHASFAQHRALSARFFLKILFQATSTDERTTHLTLSLAAEPASLSGTQGAFTLSWADDTLSPGT